MRIPAFRRGERVLLSTGEYVTITDIPEESQETLLIGEYVSKHEVKTIVFNEFQVVRSYGV